MKREFLEELLPSDMEGRKEIVDKIMSQNGEDVEKAKDKQVKDIEAERDDLKGKLEEADKKNEELEGQLKDKDETIKGLEESVGNEEELKAQIEAYKQKEAEAEAERKEAELEKGMQSRFDAVVGKNEFVNEFTKNGAYGKFKEAVGDDANKSKSDSEIYAEIMKGNEGWLKQKQNFVDIPGVEQPDVDLDKIEKFKNMTLKQKMEFANENPEEYAQIEKAL